MLQKPKKHLNMTEATLQNSTTQMSQIQKILTKQKNLQKAAMNFTMYRKSQKIQTARKNQILTQTLDLTKQKLQKAAKAMTQTDILTIQKIHILTLNS